jgi:hypothetical protein
VGVQWKIGDLVQLLNPANEGIIALGTISGVGRLGCMHHGI